MIEYDFNATNRIAETFEARGIIYDVVHRFGHEQLLAGFAIECGPAVIMRFISRNDDNDVAARIFGLISNAPEEKHSRLMKACNILNSKIRHLKFYLEDDGDVNVEYDFPVSSPDDDIGEMAFEILMRTMRILNAEYGIFMKALYTDEPLAIRAEPFPSELMKKAQELRKAVEAHLAAAGDEDEDQGDLDDALSLLALEDTTEDAAC